MSARTTRPYTRAGGAGDGEFATLEEVGQRLRCSTQTVRRLIREGELPVVELPGRLLIAWADVDAFVRARRTVRAPA